VNHASDTRAGWGGTPDGAHNGHAKPLIDADDPVKIRNRLYALEAPVRIPMRRWDLGLPFALLTFAALIVSFWISAVRNAVPRSDVTELKARSTVFEPRPTNSFSHER
jgi:hypothetical protein